MEYKHPQFDESVNVTKNKPLKQFFGFIVSVAILVVLVSVTVAFVVEMSIPHIDAKTEKWIWNNFYSSYFEPADTSKTEKIATYEARLQKILDNIPKEGLPENQYQVIVEENPLANAISLPAGKIVVYSGLVEKIGSENGLVFVLGHELGHYANRDHLKSLTGAVIKAIILSPLLLIDSSLATVTSSIDFGVTMHGSREAEYEADYYGLSVLNKYYGHVGGAEEFFQYIHENESEPEIYNYISSHPVSRERIENLRKIIAEKQFPVSKTVKFEH